MGYAVCHRDATGTLQVDDVASLDAAVERVERLRNEDGTFDVRVFREVPIEVRTYYKVVLTDDEVAPTTAGPAVDTAPTTPDEVVTVPADDAPPVASATRAAPAAAPVDTLPGAFPLASPSPVVEVHDADLDTSGDANRRHSLFSRGG